MDLFATWLLIHLVPATHASTHRYTDACAHTHTHTHTHTHAHTQTYICIYTYIDT